MPFAVAAREGVLTLTLDTPGSPINVFNRATAQQLIDVLAGVSPANTRAIVFQTAKPNSFINGVGLLLAQAARTRDDVERASVLPWAAYRAVREAPVPTIAAVQGNCFGCGVEFALNCDYRIASDTCETEFYMTEVNDYLFIPLFGSTWNLPATVGVRNAIDLLVWGARWSSTRALTEGLIDATATHDEFPSAVARFTERVLAGEQTRPSRGSIVWGADDEAVIGRAQRRIDALPPAYQAVYRDAVALLVTGARQGTSYGEHQRQELEASARSALSAQGKAAYAFFYLRQMASERAAGRAHDNDRAELRLAIEAPATAEGAGRIAHHLRTQRVPGVVIVTSGDADVRLVAAADEAPAQPNSVAIRAGIARGPVGGTEMYAPLPLPGARFLELAADREAPDGSSTIHLTRALQRFGFVVARTTPRECFVSTRLLVAYLAPLIRCIAAGGSVGAVAQALRHAGFVRRPAGLLAHLGRGPLIELLQPATALDRDAVVRALDMFSHEVLDDPPDETIIDAVCVSLLQAVQAARAAGDVSHAVTIDLIAREVLEFPRHLCSLAQWLKCERVAKALTHAAMIAPLVPATACAEAQAFVAAGREFYR